MSEGVYDVVLSGVVVFLFCSTIFASLYFHPRTHETVKGFLTLAAVVAWFVGGGLVLALVALGRRPRREVEGSAPTSAPHRRTPGEVADLSRIEAEAEENRAKAASAESAEDLRAEENRLRAAVGLPPLEGPPTPPRPLKTKEAP